MDSKEAPPPPTADENVFSPVSNSVLSPTSTWAPSPATPSPANGFAETRRGFRGIFRSGTRSSTVDGQGVQRSGHTSTMADLRGILRSGTVSSTSDGQGSLFRSNTVATLSVPPPYEETWTEQVRTALPTPPEEPSSPTATRLVICVDGSRCDPHAGSVQTNVYRIFSGLQTGKCVDSATGVTYNQVKKYIPSVVGAADDSISTKLQAALPGQGYTQQIQDLYEEVSRLNGERDEVVFFGFSRGAYVVRAVSGLIHHFGALLSAGQPSFKRDYKKLRKQVDGLYIRPSMDFSDTASLSSLSTATSKDFRPGPKIRFVGVFDTVKPATDDGAFDVSFNASIQHMRHAVAFHEDKKSLTPEVIYPEEFYGMELRKAGRSEIQAWFIGTHTDMGGSSAKGGLSLYPLQWMVLEATACGVLFDLESKAKGIDKPLTIAFPTIGGDGKAAKQASFTGVNGVAVKMQDLRHIHDHSRFRGTFGIKLTSGRSITARMKKQRRPFDANGYLRGYCDHAPQGTIIHPSVYLLLDGHITLALDTKEMKLQRGIEDWREKMLGTKNGIVNYGFWADSSLDDTLDPGAVRVLVCGNTGVGKSTLINKTFGVDVTQASDRARGIHDVKQEITFEGRPDLILHDSGGFEAGADTEYKAIEEFLKDRSSVHDVKERLHVIWFCIEINSARTLQTATEKLFSAVSTYASEVPIVVVATKKDDLLDIEFSKRRKELKKQKEAFDEEACEQFAEERLQERLEQIKSELTSVPNGRFDALVAVSQDDDESISSLSKTTSQCFDTDKVRLLYIRAQVTRIDLKVDMACAEVMRRYRALVKTAMGVSFTVSGPSIHRKTAAFKVCRAIMNCFGLPSVSADTALDAMKESVWNHLGFDISIAMAECLNTLGFIGTGFAGGIPAWAVTGALSAPMVVPSTCRLFLTMACDLILVLVRSFKEVAFRTSGQPGEKDVQAAARIYRIKGYSQYVHQDVKTMIPKRNIAACYMHDKVQIGVENIMEEYKDKLMEDQDLPLDTKRAGMRRNPTVKLVDRSLSIASSVPSLRGDHEDEDDEDDETPEAGSAFYKELRTANAKAVELDSRDAGVQLSIIKDTMEMEADGVSNMITEHRQHTFELEGSGPPVELEAPLRETVLQQDQQT